MQLLHCDKPYNLDEAAARRGTPRRKRKDSRTTAYELTIRIPEEHRRHFGGKKKLTRAVFALNKKVDLKGQVRAFEEEKNAILDLALEARGRGCVGVAYTHNEPLVGIEFVIDTARLVRERGMANVLVSNGMVNPGPLAGLVPLLDAANIDLKGFSPAFYEVAGGDFEAVRRTIATLAAAPACHLEVTTLVIPGLNDDGATIDAAAAWLASLDPAIPYHLTRFFPCHRMADRPPTPVADLHRLAAVARRHLGDVLLGNC